MLLGNPRECFEKLGTRKEEVDFDYKTFTF